jgi:thioredoxin reductase (NADPH)
MAQPAKPVILVVDDDLYSLAQMLDDLGRRYRGDYRVVGFRSHRAAIARLRTLSGRGDAVALVVADQWMPGKTGVAFLQEARQLCPAAKRMLLITYGDRTSSEPILQGMALGTLHHYFPKPWGSPEVQLYPAVGELLADWATAREGPFKLVTIIGERWSARSHELRDLFDRNGVPQQFVTADSLSGQQLLESVGLDGSRLPALVVFDGRVLVDPSNTEIAEAFGAGTRPVQASYDVAIVGGGPAGLAAAVYAASEGLKTVVVEREAIGGQAGSSSMIRNYLGFPRGVSGSDLASRASIQAWLFGAEPVMMREVTHLRADGDHRVLSLADSGEIRARAVVLATGVSYRRLAAPGVHELHGAGVFYGAAVAEAQAMAGLDVFVAGAGNSAGQAALHLAKYARRVTILVRGSSISQTMSDYLAQEITTHTNVSVLLNTEVASALGQSHLQALALVNREAGGVTEVLADALFIFIGADPRTDWLAGAVARDSRGFILTGQDLPEGGWPTARPPLRLETTMPGVFAVGDVRHGSVKRVAAGVGEGAVAVQLIHEYLAASS